ncbi:hypothetical protein Prum_014550 [Phytohabitans rumicis]|uniref:Uncharacterized protein n=1 Tax=Phytohabitans rumicis TaxID=1076125 RepID=A0A6V8KRQ0_9ACTN|nr:hypothetical protein Prum_014550 [Phytohabitans rumicis]
MTRVYTDLATFDIAPDGVYVRDLHGVSFDQLAQQLAVPLHTSGR